jgi:hypothetical protein
MLLVTGALAGIAALAACSAGTKSSNGDAGGAGLAVGKDALAAPVPAAPAHRAATAGGAGTARDAADVQLDDGTKILTASISVAVKGAGNVAAKANEAGDIVTRLGGEVDSDDRTAGKHAYATLRLLVPPDDLRTVLTQLSDLGRETSRSGSTRDVTTEVADVTSRVASAQQAIVRLRTLYGKAAKVRDVISIEDELNSRESDLESLQAQQRALARKTAMATITLQLTTAQKKPVHHAAAKHRGGFLGGLGRGWDAFRSAAGWLATALGAVLPFLLLLLVLGVGARLLWPRTRRPVPAAPSAPVE